MRESEGGKLGARGEEGECRWELERAREGGDGGMRGGEVGWDEVVRKWK